MRRALWGALLLALITLPSVATYAVLPDEMLSDRTLEARARALSRGLRCMVCQNQSIDDSEAPLARDLRILVRERLKEGDSDAQVLNYLTARYGEFVLLKPPLAWHTALLWLTPFGLLMVGAIALGVAAHRRRGAVQTPDPHLTPAEEARLSVVLRPPDSPEPGKMRP
jgi:cytochrome c-type biogenesis protein CcmH